MYANMGDQCLIIIRKNLLVEKIKVAMIFNMYLILIMNKNVPLHHNSSHYQMCISKRHKSYIININITMQTKPVS